MAIDCSRSLRFDHFPPDLGCHYAWDNQLWVTNVEPVNSIPQTDPSAWTNLGQCDQDIGLAPCNAKQFDESLTKTFPWTVLEYKGANWLTINPSVNMFPDVLAANIWVRIEDCAYGIIWPPSTSTSSNANSEAPDTRPDGPTGKNGECVWPEWVARDYGQGLYVTVGNTVYQAEYVMGASQKPPAGGWKSVGQCTGSAPASELKPEEAIQNIDPLGKLYQPFNDPWTAYLPTKSEIEAAEQAARDNPAIALAVADGLVLKGADIDGISASNPSNPGNVKRVEKIVSERLFDELFPVRNKAYTYKDFLRSIGTFPAYCKDYTDGRDSDMICRRILAASFAHYAQEVGAHIPVFNYGDANHKDVNRNPGSDAIYKTGDPIPEWKQALWSIREGDMTEEAASGMYTQCSLSSGNLMWAMNFQCWPGKGYIGRGSKQVSYNYNYGLFSTTLFEDADVLLSEPVRLAESWLNFASGIWFSVTPQNPKPSMLHVLDGTWQPNAADSANLIKPGFAATIEIINGALECRGTAPDPKGLNRVKYYREFEKVLGLPEDPNAVCTGYKGFPDKDGNAATMIYWTRTYESKAACAPTYYQTAFRVTIPGDYERCINYFFRTHWYHRDTKELVCDYGGPPGTAI